MSSDTHTSGDGAQHEDIPTDVLNDDALVGLAEDEEELSWRYKTALAPDSFKLHDECAEIDDDYYTKTLEVRDWPAIPRHGFFDDIVSFKMPKVDVTLSTHFSGENKHSADQELADSADSLKQRVRSLARNKWIPDYFVDQAAEEYADVKRTQNTISASEYSLYTSHTYIEVRAPDRDTLDTAVTRIQSRMQDVSAAAKELKYHPKEGYQTVAPACKNYLGGKTKMTGDGLARLVPWTASNLIEPGGIELGTNEDTGDPIILDLQNRETGFNVGIWGTIGSGKTTTLTRLFLRLRMNNPEIPLVIIDPKQEFAGFTWLFDGEKVTIGTDTGINPLQIEETPREQLKEGDDEGPFRNAIRRAMDFVRSYYEYQDLPFEDVQDTWRDGITEAYRRRGITDNPETHHKDSPTFKDDVFPIFVEMVRHPENFVNDALTDIDLSTEGMQKRADDILHKHTGALQEGGEFEHLAMETDIDIQNIDVLYLDLQNYENEVTAGLMMGPLLTAVLEQAKEIDEPMGLAMDEFHYMLHNSSSLETLKQAYRHSRHSDLSMITATQSVEEFFTKNDEGERQLTEDASTLTKLMSVKIWHYLEEMDDEWADEFDLTDAEQAHVEDADTGEPTAQALLSLQKGGSYRLAVDYTDKLTPREFAMNQYDPSDHGTDPLAYLDNYTNRDGKDVTEWTWLGQDDAGHGSLADQSHTGTELADGTTVTTDVADVDVTPTENPESDETDATGAEEHADDADGGESDGLTSRVKQSVSAAVGSIETSSAGASADDNESDGEGLSLTDIGTVSARTASDLQDGGFERVEQVSRAEESALAEVEGFDESKATFIREQAAKTLDEAGVDTEALAATNHDHDQSREKSSPADPSEDTETESEAEAETETATETDDIPTGAPTDEQESTHKSTEDGESDGVLGRIMNSVSPNHPAAEKSDPDVDIIGPVDAQKAAELRAAGYETALDVYEAENSALAEVEEVDETNAGYLKRMAEETLEISDASIPSSTDTHGSETAENTDQSPEDPQSPESFPDAESADADDTADESNGDEPAHQPALTDIREVGDDRADDLREAGYESVEGVAKAGQVALTEVEGIGGARAETIAESATDLLDEQSDGAVADAAGEID